MLTIKEIAAQLGITVSRARLGIKKAALSPIGKTGRTLLYSEGSPDFIANFLATTQTRKRKTNAKSTASTQAVPAGTESQQGSETALPTVGPVESDPQALPESSSDM